MEEPNFWDNPEEAQEQMKQLSSMKEDRDTYQKLVSAKEDMETLIEMGQEEDDDSVVPEIAEMMEEFKHPSMPSASKPCCPANLTRTMRSSN